MVKGPAREGEHSFISCPPAGAPAQSCLLLAWHKVMRKPQALSRSRIFGIVPVPPSIPATAAHRRHDGHLGALAAEPRLPDCHLGWEESLQVPRRLLKALDFFFLNCFLFLMHSACISDLLKDPLASNTS